jgi:hypothetical protein
MMRTVAWIILGTIASLSATANCQSSRTLMAERKGDGTTLGLVATGDQFAKAPSWKPGNGEPPLSISRVVVVVTAWGKAQFKRYDSFEIRSISLNQSGCTPGQTYWYYLVTFTPVIAGKPAYGNGQFAGVLLDGTVVGPTAVKDAF